MMDRGKAVIATVITAIQEHVVLRNFLITATQNRSSSLTLPCRKPKHGHSLQAIAIKESFAVCLAQS